MLCALSSLATRPGNGFRGREVNHEWTRIDANEGGGRGTEVTDEFVFISVDSWLKEPLHFLMTPFAYLFERFPSFGQTFCYREVAELYRQGFTPPIFSIRNPRDEPAQDWDARIVRCVHYLPEEKELLDDVRRASKKGRLAPEIVASLDEWGRRTDFLRLIRLFMSGCACRRRGSVMFMRTSRAWQRARLSGSPSFFQSPLVSPHTPTTFLRQVSLRSAWTKWLGQRA